MQDYGVYSSQDKTNIFLHGVLYAEKKLAYEDFASIEIGDNIENVIAIDPAAALCKTLYNWNTALYGEEHYFDYRAVSSLHLLTDGILEVRYLIQDEGELTVDKLFYYPDYQYMSSGYHRITGNKVYMNLTVFPQDFRRRSNSCLEMVRAAEWSGRMSPRNGWVRRETDKTSNQCCVLPFTAACRLPCSGNAVVESAGTDTLAVSDRLAQRRRYVAQYRERMIVYGRLIAAVTCAF